MKVSFKTSSLDEEMYEETKSNTFLLKYEKFSFKYLLFLSLNILSCYITECKII